MKGLISAWFDKYVNDIETPQLKFLIWVIEQEIEFREMTE